MIRLTSMLAMILAFSSITYAASPSGIALSSGVYVGAALGYANTNSDVEKNTAIPGQGNLTLHVPSVGESATVKALVGYQWLVNRYYLGVEGYISSGSVKNSSNSQLQVKGTDPGKISLNSTMKTDKPGYGADLRFGYLLFNRSVVYVLVGVNFNQVNFSGSGVADIPSSTPPGGIIIPFNNQKKTIKGFRYGLGFEQSITDNLLLDVQYTHTEYDKATFTSAAAIPGAGNVPISIDSKPSSNVFSLGINYLF